MLLRRIKKLMSINAIPSLIMAIGFSGTTVGMHNQYQEVKAQHQEIRQQNEQFHNQVKDLQKQNDTIQNSIQQKEQELQQAKQQLQEKEQQLQKAQQTATSLSSRGNEPAGGREIYVKATAYSAHPSENGGTYNGKVLTKTGFNLTDNPNAKVIAVDPSIIPLGSTVWVEGYGYAKALDTGGAIKGNRIDVFITSKEEGRKWGVRTVRVKILK
ncbi:hypothetical protein J7Q84_14580 [Bacillus sp. 165]|nr:hypothetical protein [Bacillus sp. 165]